MTQRVDLTIVASSTCTKGRFTCARRVDLPVVAARTDTKGRFTCCGKQGWHKG